MFSWWSQSMKVSFLYFREMVGFSDLVHKAVFFFPLMLKLNQKSVFVWIESMTTS